MYSYNSYHKIILAVLVVVWINYQFLGRDDESLYFENGQVKRTGIQENNYNEGTWIWYYENGQIDLKGDFLKGNRVGLWSRYDSLGHLISTSEYVDNKMNGVFTLYGDSGVVIETHEYQNDVLIKKVKF